MFGDVIKNANKSYKFREGEEPAGNPLPLLKELDPAIVEFCKASNAAVIKDAAANLGCSEVAARVVAEAWYEWTVAPAIDAAWHGRGTVNLSVSELQKILGRKIDEALKSKQM